jgi:hypothetical protein
VKTSRGNPQQAKDNASNDNGHKGSLCKTSALQWGDLLDLWTPRALLPKRHNLMQAQL